MGDLRISTAALLLATVAALGGCTNDPPTTDGTTGSGGGTTSGTTGGSVPYELVATDQLSVSPDGSQVLADCWNGICRWDAGDGSLELVPDRGSAAVSPDWSTVATVDDADIVLEDLDSGDPVADLTGLATDDVADGSPVSAVAYSPDGSLVAAAGRAGDGGGRLVVWSIDGAEEASFDTASEVHRIAFAPDGERLATVGNGPVQVHDLATGASQELASGEGGTVAWSGDGGLLLGPGADDQPVVWETDTWRLVAELRGVRLHEAAFAPEGAAVALTALDDTAVTLWNPAAESPRARDLTGHTGEPGAVAWSPDGSVLYSVSADDGVRAWSPRRGAPAALELELPEGRG